MTAFTHHIERVKAKPHHIRKQIAFGVAALITVLIGLLWLGSSVATGAFALTSSPFNEQAAAPVQASGASSNQIGAAAGIFSSSEPAHIEVVSDKPQVEPAKKADPTVIPF